MLQGLGRKWDLDRWFLGGSTSEEFKCYLDSLKSDIDGLQQHVQSMNPRTAGVSAWAGLVEQIQDAGFRLRNAGAFTGCLTAQDTGDRRATALAAQGRQLSAALATVFTTLDEHLLALADERWNELLDSEQLRPVAFNLDEQRRRAREQLPTQQEMLVNSLSVDGYHAWASLYDEVAGKVFVDFSLDGQTRHLSAAQAANKMSDPDREVRRSVFDGWERAWGEAADLCAAALNHLAGFRLALYDARGWDDVLYEPLELNRMTRKTLDAMWNTIDDNKSRLVRYLERKKRLLGIQQFAWFDQGAPLGKSANSISFDESASFVVEQMRGFSPKIADLMRRAFEGGWIESEDRPNKRGGAFCTSALSLGESRVFLTFSGNPRNSSTLAHELGHAYHQSVMNGLPYLSMRYAMNVAETASTFSELVVADATLRQAESDNEKITLLSRKLDSAVALLMNIQARFLFETRFYERRRKGIVGVDKLNELMVGAQQEAFAGMLDVYHPHFWASKLHFYRTGTPFYNFPYTFGYLFSNGVYARAVERGVDFEDDYASLLRDTGRMRVEDLANKHLGVDLTRTDFWQSAIDVATRDLDEFLRLTE